MPIFSKIVLHNLNRPLKARARARDHVGPYYFNPVDGVRDGFSFYYNGGSIVGGHGSPVRLRLAEPDPNEYRTQLEKWGNNDLIEDYTAIVLRLPRGRGFLAGWTMGENMVSEVSCDIHNELIDAVYAANSMTESVCEKEAEYQREWATASCAAQDVSDHWIDARTHLKDVREALAVLDCDHASAAIILPLIRSSYRAAMKSRKMANELTAEWGHHDGFCE